MNIENFIRCLLWRESHKITHPAVHKEISSKEIQKQQKYRDVRHRTPNDQFLAVNLTFFSTRGRFAPFVCPLNNIRTRAIMENRKKAFLTLPLLYYLWCPRIISINRCLSYISFPFLYFYLEPLFLSAFMSIYQKKFFSRFIITGLSTNFNT